MTVRTPLALALTLAALVAGAPAPVAAQSEAPRAFLELFTSQGCAACPPADTLLERLADEPGVLAVTLPVKLWDFLGWEDTLASRPNTDRQMAYSVARGDHDVFTPQMVVNGGPSVVASDLSAVEAAIASTERQLTLPITVASTDGVLEVNVAADAPGTKGEATLWLMVVEDVVTVPVGAGENRGRSLTYHNVVQSMRPIGMWQGEAMMLRLPLTEVEKRATAGCVIIAQEHTFKGPGRIIGAAQAETLFPAREVAGR